MKKFLFVFFFLQISFTIFALHPDLIGQLKNAIGKVPPSSAIRSSRTEYYRDVEEDYYHAIVQNYTLSEGKVVKTAFQWIGRAGYIESIMGELFNLMDSFGEPDLEISNNALWIKDGYGIEINSWKGEDGYFHATITVVKI